MDKLHIKAVAGRNIKVDANWYRYGEEMDCYLTPAQFKDYLEGFLEYEIVDDSNSTPKSIDVEFKVVEEKKEVVKDEQTSGPNNNEKRVVSKNTKKTV
jgi:hypothetical protein